MSGGGTLAVVISMTAAEIHGKVTSPDGQPAAASVVILPDPLQPGNNDLYHRLHTKADGSFVAGGLAPGRYRVYADVKDNDKKTVTLDRISKEKAQEVLHASQK
jgi:small ligand-binding sensory domain FIST